MRQRSRLSPGVLLVAAVTNACAAMSGSSPDPVTLTIVSWGGAYQDAQTAAWFEPYAEVTPHVALVQDGPSDYAAFGAMANAGNVTWDVVDIENGFGLDRTGHLLEPIDCDEVPWHELQPEVITTGYRVPVMSRGRVQRAGALIQADYLALPRGAPNVDAAMDLIACITSAEHNARLADHISYAPANALATRMVDPEMQPHLPSTYSDITVARNDVWLEADFETVESACAAWSAEPEPEAVAGEQETRQPRFAADNARFEAADRESPPAPGGIVFVGSSSIRLWSTLAEDFPGLPAINRGFGGSRISDVLYYANRIIIPYRPSHVVVYAGENDLAEGGTYQQVVADYRALVERVRDALPDVRISWISMKPSPSRWHLVEAMREGNRMIEEFSSEDPLLDYIDVFDPMLGENGRPIPNLFVSDSLHMTPAGYAVWRSVVGPYVGVGDRK